MRLRDREAHYRHTNNVLTVDDVRKAAREKAAASKRAEEQQQRAAKQAAKGPALPGLEVER